MASVITVAPREAAVSFLRLASSGNVREAYDRFVAPNFRHHNPYFRGDAASLAAGMAENAAENPHKVFEVKHVLEEGDLVAVHGRVRLKPDSEDVALFHLFRFADGRIVELWDVAQPAPADSPNEYGMF
jgi:predicted SnoaL-like aldol condensation-catalyzing enzyme